MKRTEGMIRGACLVEKVHGRAQPRKPAAHHGNSPVRFLYEDENGKRVGMRAGPAWRVKLTADLFDELNQLLAPGGRAIAVGEQKQIERDEGPHWKRRHDA